MKRLWMLNEWSPERRNEEVVQAQTANSEQEEGVEERPLDPSQPSVITARQREAPRTPAKRKRTGLSTDVREEDTKRMRGRPAKERKREKVRL